MGRPSKHNLTKEDELEIVRLYEDECLGTPSIAKMYGVGNYTISYLLDKKYKVKKRSNKINSRKYNANFNYFESIDSAEKAYWLGFIYADGFVLSDRNVFGISLQRKDREHLQAFKDCLNSDYPIADYETTESSYKVNTPYSRFSITSRKMKEDLVSHGVFKNKSNILLYPTSVPNEFIYDWCRGYFDGDGSLSFNSITSEYKFRFVGTREVLVGIQKLFGVEHLSLTKRKEDNNNNYALDIGGHNQIIPMLDKLYENSTIHLQRKYVRYCNLKTVVHSRNAV